MKYILSVILLLSFTHSLPLFHCWSKAAEHVKLKETKNKKDQEDFLEKHINLSKNITVPLAGTDQSPARIVKRMVSLEEYRMKRGTWTLEISRDIQECLHIQPVQISVPRTGNGNVEFSWNLQPQKSGFVLVKTIYDSKTREHPLVQEFLVTIE